MLLDPNDALLKVLGCTLIALILTSCSQKIGGASSSVNERSSSSPEEQSSNSTVPKIFDYGAYVNRFKKVYTPVQTLAKAQLFFGRTLKIFQHNVLYLHKKVSYYLSQNEYTDIPVEELKLKYLNNENLDLKPVVEALKDPDAPADIFDESSHLINPLEPSESRAAEGDKVIQGTSRLIELHSDRKTKEKLLKKPLTFLDNQHIEVGDIKEMLKSLKTQPHIAAKIAQLVELDKKEKELFPTSSAGLSKNKEIEHKAMVRPTNENYEPEMITSYGLFSTLDPHWEPDNYANFLMGEGFTFEPYPTAEVIPLKDGKRSSLAALLGSVKNMYNYLVEDDLVWEPDEEIVPASTDDAPKVKTNEIKYDIDWRDTGCITKPQTQLFCNSCYAFATLSLMEYFYCKESKELTDFSAQYVIDCGAKLSIGGCKGGKISSVGSFITRYGIELSSLYPYNGMENECPYSDEDEKQKKPGFLRPQITHWHMFPEMSAWFKWIKKSPVVVGINMPTDFLAYGGGIHDGLDCTQDMVHALLLVGSGTQDGKSFWLMKNSFSDKWGEDGYFRLSKSAPVRCFNAATVVRTNFLIDNEKTDKSS